MDNFADPKFVEGRPCSKHGGTRVRYRSNHACYKCVRERAAAQRRKLIEKAAGNISPPQPTAVDDGEDLI